MAPCPPNGPRPILLQRVSDLCPSVRVPTGRVAGLADRQNRGLDQAPECHPINDKVFEIGYKQESFKPGKRANQLISEEWVTINNRVAFANDQKPQDVIFDGGTPHEQSSMTLQIPSGKLESP